MEFAFQKLDVWQLIDAIINQADVVARKITGLINSLKTDIGAART